MIEINLLPKELRKKKARIGLPNVRLVPIIFGTVGLIVAIQLIFTTTVAAKKHRLKALGEKLDKIAPEAEGVIAVNNEVNALKRKAKGLEGIKTNRLLWARKLNDLSDSVVSGMWLTKLSLNETPERKYLSIEGNVSSYSKDEAAVIGRFMKALKENKSFFRDFEDIQLNTMQQTKVKNMNVMSFSINCYFKEGEQGEG